MAVFAATNMRACPGGAALAAPLDVVFDEYDVLQPDVLFFRAERRHLIRPDAVTRHAPDIAVEVLSPSTAAADRSRKMRRGAISRACLFLFSPRSDYAERC